MNAIRQHWSVNYMKKRSRRSIRSKSVTKVIAESYDGQVLVKNAKFMWNLRKKWFGWGCWYDVVNSSSFTLFERDQIKFGFSNKLSSVTIKLRENSSKNIILIYAIVRSNNNHKCIIESLKLSLSEISKKRHFCDWKNSLTSSVTAIYAYWHWRRRHEVNKVMAIEGRTNERNETWMRQESRR